MRPRHRGIFAAFSAVAIASLAIWVVSYLYLPPPQNASWPQLQRWMVLRELEHQPQEIQLALVDRFQDHMLAGVTIDGSDDSLPDTYLQRLYRNAELLKRVWFYTRVQQYVDCSPEQRWYFLNRQVELVLIWANVDFSPADDAGYSAEQRHDFAMQFFGDIERWISQADSETAAEMQLAVQDGLTCWLATRSIIDEPMATRQHLANCIVQQLNAGLRLDQLSLKLNDRQQATLIENSQLLLEAWLLAQSAHYAELPPDERSSFVDSRIDDFLQWGFFDLIAGSSDKATDTSSGSVMQELPKLVETWVQRTPPHQQAAMRRLLMDVQQRLIWRLLQQTLQATLR